MVAELRSFIKGELQVEPDTARHGYDDDDFDIVDAGGWNQYDSYAMRRAPLNPYEAADDHEGSPCICRDNQFLCL